MIPAGPFVQTKYLRPYLDLNLRFRERADIVTSIFSWRRITIISSKRSSSAAKERSERRSGVVSDAPVSSLDCPRSPYQTHPWARATYTNTARFPFEIIQITLIFKPGSSNYRSANANSQSFCQQITDLFLLFLLFKKVDKFPPNFICLTKTLSKNVQFMFFIF